MVIVSDYNVTDIFLLLLKQTVAYSRSWLCTTVQSIKIFLVYWVYKQQSSKGIKLFFPPHLTVGELLVVLWVSSQKLRSLMAVTHIKVN